MSIPSSATLLAGLSSADKIELASLSTHALELEARRLSVQSKRLQLQAFGVGDAASIDKASAEIDAGELLIDKHLATAPHLAKPLAAIRELAKRAHDPEAVKALTHMRSELGAASPAPALAADVPQLANEVEGQGVSAALSSRYNPKAIPDEVVGRYDVRGKQFVNPRDAKVAFVDHGSRLQTNKSFDGYAIKSMVAIAEARGWESIKVTGDEAFRRAIWFEAASRGIAVKGYKPTVAEQQSMTSMAERNGRLNRIEENPAAKAFLNATDGSGRYVASKAHPELKQAFALEAALKKFAEQRLQPKDRDAFVEHQRKNIANDLAQGKDLPAVSVRVNRYRDRERQPEAEH